MQLMDVDWKGRRFEGDWKGRRCWMGRQLEGTSLLEWELEGTSIGRIRTLIGRVGSGWGLEGTAIGGDVDWKDPDVVTGWGLEGLDPNGDWKGRRLEGSGRRCWMGIGRDVNWMQLLEEDEVVGSG